MELLYIADKNAKYSHFSKQFGQFLIKLNAHQPYHPTSHSLGFTWEKRMLMFPQNLYASIYISFIQNHPKLETTQRSFTDEWINKLWYKYSMELHLAIKSNELLIPHSNMDKS